MKGNTSTIQIGTDEETPIPMLMAIRETWVAVSNPNPNRTPIGKICQGLFTILNRGLK
jgi:hypothetical protein